MKMRKIKTKQPKFLKSDFLISSNFIKNKENIAYKKDKNNFSRN